MSEPVVVVGATGGVGRGIVEALAAAGRPIVAVGRDPQRLQALAMRFPSVTPVSAALDGDAGGSTLADALRSLRRPVGGVVASLMGPLERGRLLQQPAAFLQRKLHEDLLPHFVAARHLLPLLAAGSRPAPYLVIGGPCAQNPWAGYGHLSVVAAALRMLVAVLRQESVGSQVRIQQLDVESPVRTGRSGICECPQWPSAAEVGRRVAEILDGAAGSDAVIRFAPVAFGGSGAHNESNRKQEVET